MNEGYLRFGIESEVFLVPRQSSDDFTSLEGFANFMIKTYNDKKRTAWPKMHLDIDGSYKGHDQAIEWTLTNDSSLKPDHVDKQFPLELVSPILEFTSTSDWRKAVVGLWDIFNSLCLIQTNKTCGTHVHISPAAGFESPSAKSIARAILYFESAINGLVPADRRNNEYRKSLRGNGLKFKGKTTQQCIAVVDACSTLDDLIDAMNGNTRYWTWNFQNLTQGRKMTIEFRQPPGVVTSTQCLAWAEFTITFCQAAIKTAGSYHALSVYSEDVGGLKSFMKTGIVTGASDPELLDNVFGSVKETQKVHSQSVAVLGQDRWERLEKKMKEDETKNTFTKKMKLVNLR